MWETSSSDQRACLKHADVGESEGSRPNRGSRKSLWRTQKQQQHQQPSRSNPALSPLLTGSGPRKTSTLRQLFQKTRVLAKEGQSAPWLMEGWLSGQSYPAGSPLLHGTGGGRAICIPDKPVSAQVRHRIKLKKVCEKVKMVHTQIVTLYKNKLHRF